MQPIIKFYIKTFFGTGVAFALIVSLGDLVGSNGFNIMQSLSSGLFFGAAMCLTLVPLHIYKLKNIGIKEITDESLRTIQTKYLKSKLNEFDLVEKLRKDPVIGKMKMSKLEDGIQLITEMSWKSFGEKIKITLISKSESVFDYQVTSRPKIRTTLVDFGKSIENVNLIEKVINKVA